MGRYITGDIDHKLWFGVQPSDAASQFGGEMEHTYVQYGYGCMEDFKIEHIDSLIEKFNKASGEKIDKAIDSKWFWDWQRNVKDTQLIELAADIQLGIRIYQCLLEEGQCYFQAEL